MAATGLQYINSCFLCYYLKDINVCPKQVTIRKLFYMHQSMRLHAMLYNKRIYSIQHTIFQRFKILAFLNFHFLFSARCLDANSSWEVSAARNIALC